MFHWTTVDLVCWVGSDGNANANAVELSELTTQQSLWTLATEFPDSFSQHVPHHFLRRKHQRWGFLVPSISPVEGDASSQLDSNRICKYHVTIRNLQSSQLFQHLSYKQNKNIVCFKKFSFSLHSTTCSYFILGSWFQIVYPLSILSTLT